MHSPALRYASPPTSSPFATSFEQNQIYVSQPAFGLSVGNAPNPPSHPGIKEPQLPFPFYEEPSRVTKQSNGKLHYTCHTETHEYPTFNLVLNTPVLMNYVNVAALRYHLVVTKSQIKTVLMNCLTPPITRKWYISININNFDNF